MNYWDMTIELLDITLMLFIIAYVSGIIIFGLIAAHNTVVGVMDKFSPRHPIIIYQRHEDGREEYK
tara:strand:- start:315 stop:512 length:198 start_codon:yes stop_codon:yes gene_type:complete